VILLTATDDPNLVPRAHAVGASAVLTKPCTAGHLRATIETAIQQRRDKAVWGNRH
jgi:PleD family two-component response regulator